MDGNEEEEKVFEASQVFLLMGKEYRISRSIRAQWFFQQFNSVLPQPKSEEELLASNEELEILSVLSDKPKTSSSSGNLHLVPSTHITFVGRKYRFLFCLDISPSLAIVDIQTGSVITDEVFQKFKNCLTGLVAPFSVPGNKIVLRPELYITVLAYTSILSPETPQILVQGVLVNEKNVDVILSMVSSKLTRLETILAEIVASTHSSEQRNQKPESDTENFQGDPVTLLSPEAGPIAMLRSAILALQLLPDNASAGAVVITDGVFALPDASAVDSLLAQLRGSTVCCTFLKVGSGFHAHCSIGYLPHCDLMQFIAMATSGAYLANTPPVVKEANKESSQDPPVMNLYHKSLLCWSFQRDYDLSKIESWIGDAIDLNEDDLAWPLLNSRSTFSYALSEWERNAMQPSMHKKQMEAKLHTSITSVISVRLREGYSVQDVSITKGGKQLEVTLTLPWKQHVQIQYVAVAAWPLSRSNRVSHIAVTITAPYEFLHDVSYLSKESITSSYRTMVVKKFRQTMKNIQSTDEVLIHLQSFSSNPSYYTIPNSSRNGVPLFYLPPNSSNPVLSLQHERKSSKSQESQFAVFWKPVLTLDTTVWQRWLHCHRIGLILEHDVPLPKNLHLPISNDHFHSIQCRMALSSLNSLLRSISSFVLLENHSYIKFIDGESADSPPSSFCLIRVSSRAPCIVIRLAFLGGTPGQIRHAITKELRSNLRKVTAPIGPVSKVSSIKQDNKAKKTKKKGAQRLAEDKPCVLVLKKPLERILVRYERVPEDLFSPYPEGLLYSVYSTNTGLQYANRTNENHMKVLCHYMYHQRWVWSVQEDEPRHLNSEVVATVLNTLTKLRLQEKFNFASTNAGIITMAKELQLQDKTCPNTKPYSCIVQYVMFPPYCKTSADAVKDWVDGGQSPLPQVDEKLQMVTEVWIEPQFGVITSEEEEIQYLNGLQYYDVPQAIFEADYKYVSAFLTFERLWCMCDDQIISAPSATDSVQSTTRPLPSPDRNWTVETVPYPFDSILLLPKARQVEMVFSSLKETAVQDSSVQGELPNEALFKLILDEMNRLHDREIMLSDKNCLELMKHIVQRERSGIPVPFVDFVNTADKSQSDKPADDTTPLIKWKCFVRSVQGLAGNCRLMLTFLPASLKYVKLYCTQIRHCYDNKTTSGAKKEVVVMEKVKSALATRMLTPIMEDNEKRVLSPPIPDPSQDALPDDELLEKDMFDLLSPSNGDNTAKSTQEQESQDSKSSHDSEGDSKYVKFKEDDVPTPTKENMSPLTPCTPNMEADGWLSYCVPIYCYDCPLYHLTHVEEKQEPGQTGQKTADFRKREDIYQDFTNASQMFVDPFSLEELPRMVEGRTVGRFGSSKDLLLHCNAVHDIFFRCFVTSIFTSLQHGHQVNVRDVQSAVDTCEENFLEIDITEFIHTLCGHFPRDPDLPRSPEAFRGPSSLLLCQKTQSPIFQRENFQEFVTLAFLKSYFNDNCESALGLHQSIKNRFMSILGRYFKSIPSFGDMFFYCPQSTSINRKSTTGSFEPEEDQDFVNEDDKSDAGSEVFGETVVLIQDNDLDQYEDPDYPLSDDSDSDFGGSDQDSDDLGDVEDDDKSLSTPLFLQLTCSLRDRRAIGGGTMTPVPIESLPVCIGEIVRRMEEAEDSVDLFSSSLQITIDLNCLTLSPLPDYSTLKSSVNHPTFSTSFSGSCCESPASMSPQEKFEFRRQDSKTVTSHDIDGLNGPDPLRGLPQQQRLAMNVTCEGIQWLLQDEVVSELRYSGPYTSFTLDKVERHVQRSEGHPLCIYRNISLQFVFGAEQSMELFMKEFEEMNNLDYKLNKVDEYYYLTEMDEEKDFSDIEERKTSSKLSKASSHDNSEEHLQSEEEQLPNIEQVDHKSPEEKAQENKESSLLPHAQLSPERSESNSLKNQEATQAEHGETLPKVQKVKSTVSSQDKSSTIQSTTVDKIEGVSSDISANVENSSPTEKAAPESTLQSQSPSAKPSGTQSPEKDKDTSTTVSPTLLEESKDKGDSPATFDLLSKVEKQSEELKEGQGVEMKPENICMKEEQKTKLKPTTGELLLHGSHDTANKTAEKEVKKAVESELGVTSDDKDGNSISDRKREPVASKTTNKEREQSATGQEHHESERTTKANTENKVDSGQLETKDREGKSQIEICHQGNIGEDKKENKAETVLQNNVQENETKHEELNGGEVEERESGESKQKKSFDQGQMEGEQGQDEVTNEDEIDENTITEKEAISEESTTDELVQEPLKHSTEGVGFDENLTREKEQPSDKDKLDEKMKIEQETGDKFTSTDGEQVTNNKLGKNFPCSNNDSTEEEKVSTKVDVSVPLSVITTGTPFAFNDELSTPVPEGEFSYPAEAASTPIKRQDGDDYLKGTSEKPLKLITSSHHAASLDLISPIDTEKDGIDLSSRTKENQGQDSSSSSNKKQSPRETKQKLKFWLVLRLCDNFVDIFFHRRHSEDSLMSPTMAGGLIEVVVNAIHENCRAVNQRMLLQDLYDTKMCNSLLFPEADEDIWKHEDLRMSVSPVGVYISKSDGSGYIGRYVQGEFIFQPGHFQCSSKWYSHLIFHPRLQDPSGNSSNSLGRKIIRSVLDRFGVRNRRDMFVYKESSGRIFYFRLLESLCVCADQPQLPEDVQDIDDQDDQSHNDAMSNASQKGSQLSLSQISLTREQEHDDDLSEPRLKKSLTSLPRDKVEQSLAFHVYGVDEPGTEITDDLLEVLINRLDEATLDALTFMLSRNPNSKLNYADVTFIQPPDEPPSDSIFIVIPPIDTGYLYPLFFYLKQNLLQIFTIPRYADTNPRHHFRNTGSGQEDKSTAIFIYNRPQSSGAKCVACIAMRFLRNNKEQIHFDVARIPSINVEHLDRNFYEDMTEVESLNEETIVEDNFIVEFSIWKRGSIGLEQLTNQLKCITQHALCDLLMEYLLLPAPLSSIPEEYFVTQTFKLRSLSAPPTPSEMSPRTIKVGDKSEPAKQGAQVDAVTPDKGGRESVLRKISSDSIKSAPCFHRTQSNDSQGMEFKSVHDKQTVKGHRRTKSAEVRDKIFKKKKSPTTSKNTSETTLSNEESTSKPQRKLGFQVFADGTINEAVAKDADDTVVKVTVNDSVAKDVDVSIEDAELALEVSCEKSPRKLEESPKCNEDLPTTENHFPAEKSRSHGDLHLKLEETYDTFSQQEILESQEYASTPTGQDKYLPPLTINKAGAGDAVSLGDPEQYSSSLKCSSTTPLLNIKRDETWQDVEIRRRKIKEKIKKRMKYENGQRGELHPNFHEPGRELFSFAHGLGAPSVHSMEATILSRFAVDFLLSELTTLLSSLCPDMTPRIYRQAPEHHHDNCSYESSSCGTEDHRCSCPKYKPGREPLKAQCEDETPVDQKGRVYVRSPGSPCFFALISRDYNQWRSCLGMDNDEEDDDSVNTSRGFAGRQRFKAMESSIMSSKSGESSSLCSTSACTIPRQKLILLTFIDKKLILYTYNLAVDVNQSLEDQIQRLIHWNNARCHFTNCLITQKMGLFHHLGFAQLNDGKKGKEENPYCLPSCDMDVFALISKTAPSERERGWSRSLSPGYLNVLDEVLRDVTPSRPLQRTPYLNHRDPVKRQGYHFREIRAVQIKTNTIQSALDDLYVKWQQAPPHHPVADDRLDILKRSSRLVHYCACPLLFHPDWREKLSTDTRCINDTFPTSRRATVYSLGTRVHDSTSSRSTHDSASGVRSKLDTVSESRSETDAAPRPDTVKVKGAHSSKEKAILEKEEEWHKNLRSAFIQQYVQYMQSLQFVVVQTRPHSPKPVKGSRKQARRSINLKHKGEHNGGDTTKKQVLFRSNSDQTRFHQYLQKTSPGGIMLMELIFQGLYFYVRLYAIDCSRIPSGSTTGQHESRIFLEDCSHYKDYIHLLSFTYDFHLRQAQFFLSGRQMIFNKGYRVTDLLAEILRKHPEYPGFARNHICKGEIAVPCDPVISSLNVFKYIVKHSSQYEFSTIRVKKLDSQDTNFILLGTDQVLTPARSKDSQHYSNLRDNAEYDITLVVTLKNSFEGSVIHLEYYIIMTSRRELFPKLSLRIPGKAPYGSHGNSDPMERRGSSEVKSPRVRFARNVPEISISQTRYSPERKPRQTLDLQSSFHRSASSPHSLNKMVQDITKSSIPQSQSDENIAEAKKKLGTSPHSYSSGALSIMDGRSSREVALLNESSLRAHDHLIHVICRAQTHSKRDMLWFRLLAGGTGDEEKETKKRRKSEFRRPLPDLAENWSTGIEVEELYKDIGNERTTSKDLSVDELKLLLSIVVCKSLKNFDKNLVPLLSMNVNWYQGLLRVLIAKFSTLYRSFSLTNDDNDVHYLVILNPKELDMFVLVVVDMKDNKTDIQMVFREESKADLTVDLLINQNSIKEHIYSVLNAACFHMWATMLPS